MFELLHTFVCDYLIKYAKTLFTKKYIFSTTGNYQVAPTVQKHPDTVEIEEIEETHEEQEQADELEDGGTTPQTQKGQRGMNSSYRSSKKRRTTDLYDERIEEILSKAESVLDTQPRHAAFSAYLTERMGMLPLQVARDLEVEFTCRVNSLLDLYSPSDE